MRYACAFLACVALGLPARADDPTSASTPAAEELRTVTVSAEGYNRDDALKQAMRKALEQGAGVQIAGFSQVENFALIRDTIYSRASGIVNDYRVIKEGEGASGVYEITIEARVRPSAVAQTWGEVQNVLDQIGRPKIMVWIDERIDGQLDDDSIVQSRIEQLFLKAGFDLVDRKGTEDLRRREAGDAADEKDAAKVARLAKDAGAHILIRGVANADRVGIRDVYGVKAAFYNCSVQARIYYTDTGKLLVSESIPSRERGVRSYNEYSPQAARAALVAATFPDSDTRREPVLATRLFEAVMEQWSTLLSAAGDIELEVEGLDFKLYASLRKALQDLPGVRSVDGDFTKGAAQFRIKAQTTAATLAERFIAPPFDKWIEVVDLKPTRIQARVSARPE